MSDVRAEISASFGQKATECVPRRVSHSVGASSFFLAYAMAQSGVLTFTIVLVIEAYFTGYSTLYIQEMMKHRENHQPNTGIQHNNYFMVIEKNLSKNVRHFVRVLFMIDVIICTSFYYKVMQGQIEGLMYRDHVSKRNRTGTTILTCALTTLFLIGMEYGQKYFQAHKQTHQPPPNAIHEIKAVKISRLIINRAESPECSRREARGSTEERGINMEAVSREMNNFDRKRPLLLLLFMLLFFATVAVSHDVANAHELTLIPNVTENCPGLTKPINWVNMDGRIMVVTAMILYSLRSFAMMLPVHVEEMHYEREDFSKIVMLSTAVLFIIYFFFPLFIYTTFGESTPAFFLGAYGKNVIGIPIMAIAVAFTGVAMSLRILACFKLIQVLYCEIDTENVFWLVVILSVFASLNLALVATDVTYLVIVAGAITSNLLSVIIPSLAYIKFKWTEEKFGSNIVRAMCSLLWHITLLGGAAVALYLNNPLMGKGCRLTMDYYWN